MSGTGTNNVNPNAGRLEEYDISKGIAIYLVVLGHLLGQTFCVGTQLQNIITFCHMPVFFFISGFFLFHSINKYPKKKLLLNKMRQLLVPYFCWSFISFVANIIFHITDDAIADVVKEEFVQIFINGRSVWFLVVLFITQCIAVGLAWLSSVIHVNKYMILILGWLLLSVCVPDSYFSMYRFKWLFPFLIIGIFYAENREKLGTWQRAGAVSLLFPFVCIIAFEPVYYKMYLEFCYDGFKSVMVGVGYYIISLLGIFLVLFLSSLLKKVKFGKIIAETGRYSMEIYVMHMLFIKFLVFVPTTMYNNEAVTTYLYIILYSIVVIALIILLTKYILNRFKIFRVIMGKNNSVNKISVNSDIS